jgi:hypothetical protein
MATARTSLLAPSPRAASRGHRQSRFSNRRSRRHCATCCWESSAILPLRIKRPPGPGRPWLPRTPSPRAIAGLWRLNLRRGWDSWRTMASVVRHWAHLGLQKARRARSGCQCESTMRWLGILTRGRCAQRATPLPRPRAPPVRVGAAVPDLRPAADGCPPSAVRPAACSWPQGQRRIHRAVVSDAPSGTPPTRRRVRMVGDEQG